MGQQAQIGRFAHVACLRRHSRCRRGTTSRRARRSSTTSSATARRPCAVGFNKFMTAATTGFAQLYNPTGAQPRANLAWTDLNGDDIAQGERGCTFRTAGCEINFVDAAGEFRRPRAGVVRSGPASVHIRLAFNLGVSHEVLPGRRGHRRVVPQRLQGPDRAQQRRAHGDRLHAGDGRTARSTAAPITVYNISAAKVQRGAERRQHRSGSEARATTAIEINFNARLPRGARIFGGTVDRADDGQHVQRGGQRSEPARSTATSARTTSRSRRRSSWPARTRCRGTASRSAARIRAWPATLLGSDALPYGVFTAGTGFDAAERPAARSGRWRARRRYAANCKRRLHAGRASSFPSLTSATINVPLTAPGPSTRRASTRSTSRVEQDVHGRQHPLHAEAGHLQCVQLGRLHGGRAACSSARPPTSGRR